MFKKNLLILFLISFWISSGAQVSQTIELDSVKIQKSKISVPLSSTQAGQQLTKKELDQRNILQVGEALQQFNGVQIRNYGGIGGMKTVDVRNLGSKHTVVFYDGMAINEAQSGEIDLSKFSTGNLASLSLFQNNYPSIFQPAKAFSAASALYLQARTPVFLPGKTSNWRASIAGGSFGLVNGQLDVESKINSRWSVSVSGEALHANGEYDFHYKNAFLLDTVIRRKNTDIKTQRVELALQGIGKDSSQWNLRGYGYFSERGLPGPALNNNYYAGDRQWDKDFFVQGSWQLKPADRYSLKVLSKVTYNYLRYLDPNYSNEVGKLDNRYEQQEYYVSVLQGYRFSSPLFLSLSTDYSFQKMEASLPNFAYPSRHTALLNLAADYTGHGWRLQANLLGTFQNEQVKRGQASDSQQELSPSVSFSWKPFESQELYLRSAYKSIFRMPTFNDTYYTLIGTINLKPEYAKTYNLGLTYQKEFSSPFKLLSWTLDAYENRITDRIVAIPQSFRWAMVNVGKAVIRGIESSVRGEVDFNSFLVNWQVQANWQDPKDRTPNTSYFNQDLPYAPRFVGSFSGSVQVKNWTFGTQLQYSGEKYHSRSNLASNVIGSWFLQDLQTAYLLKVREIPFRVSLSVHNLYDKDYVILNNYPMPGRNFRVGLNTSF